MQTDPMSRSGQPSEVNDPEFNKDEVEKNIFDSVMAVFPMMPFVLFLVHGLYSMNAWILSISQKYSIVKDLNEFFGIGLGALATSFLMLPSRFARNDYLAGPLATFNIFLVSYYFFNYAQKSGYTPNNGLILVATSALVFFYLFSVIPIIPVVLSFSFAQFDTIKYEFKRFRITGLSDKQIAFRLFLLDPIITTISLTIAFAFAYHEPRLLNLHAGDWLSQLKFLTIVVLIWQTIEMTLLDLSNLNLPSFGGSVSMFFIGIIYSTLTLLLPLYLLDSQNVWTRLYFAGAFLFHAFMQLFILGANYNTRDPERTTIDQGMKVITQPPIPWKS